MGLIENVLKQTLPSQKELTPRQLSTMLNLLYQTVSRMTTADIPVAENVNFVTTDQVKAIDGQQVVSYWGIASLTEGSFSVGITGVDTGNLVLLSFNQINSGNIANTKFYQGLCTANTLSVTALKSDGTTNTDDTAMINYAILAPTALP